MNTNPRLARYLEGLCKNDPVCLYALDGWQTGTVAGVTGEDLAIVQDGQVLYLPLGEIRAWREPWRDPIERLCAPFAVAEPHLLTAAEAMELALKVEDTAFAAEVRPLAERLRTADEGQMHDLCAAAVTRVAAPFAHIPEAHTLYAALWLEGKPGRDLREMAAAQFLLGGQYESALALGPTDPMDRAALAVLVLESGAECMAAVAELADTGANASAWLGVNAHRLTQSRDWLLAAGMYLLLQDGCLPSDLPAPDAPGAWKQVVERLCALGDPAGLSAQAEGLRLVCPPAPVAAAEPVQPVYYTAHITYYSPFKHIGYLRRDDGEELGTFFHFNQVNDPLLRQLLERGQGLELAVRCRLGMRTTPTGVRHQADDVCLLNTDVLPKDPRISGVLGYFLAQGTPPYGRIRDAQGREYKFLLSDLLDPSIRPELEGSFTTRFDLPVTFLPHMRPGQRLHTARRICRAQPLSETELARLKVDPAAMEAMAQQLAADKPDPDAPMTSPYEPLELYDPAKAQPAAGPSRLPYPLFAAADDEADIPF